MTWRVLIARPHSSDAPPVSVLFAEDNALNRTILTAQLKRLGDFRVRCVVGSGR
jgi:CheY-like chemotaxis protein